MTGRDGLVRGHLDWQSRGQGVKSPQLHFRESLSTSGGFRRSREWFAECGFHLESAKRSPASASVRVQSPIEDRVNRIKPTGILAALRESVPIHKRAWSSTAMPLTGILTRGGCIGTERKESGDVQFNHSQASSESAS